MKGICNNCGNIIETGISGFGNIVVYFLLAFGIFSILDRIISGFLVYLIGAVIFLIIYFLKFLSGKIICPKCNGETIIKLDSKEGIEIYNKFNNNGNKDIESKFILFDQHENKILKKNKLICPKCNTENAEINSFCTKCHYVFTNEDKNK